MSGDLKHHFEHLFEHQEWVRALALRLAGESAAADDLVQDTWVEALQARRVPESPRQWLGGIVRNLARSTRRRDGARTERERRAATHDALPSSAELLERAELQRRVLAAVASLDEPYRVVVLLRYAEGLDGEHIAERLGVPGSTVRNRLARALERLREKLDGEYGSRGSWALLFVPTFSDAAVKTLVVGGWIVKAQIAIAAALVVAATVLWWPRSDESNEKATPAIPGVASVLHAGTGTASVPEDREPALDANAPRSVAARVERVMLNGRVIGPSDEETSGETFRVVGADGIERPFTAGIDGAYSVFGLPPGPARASVWVVGFLPFFEEFEVGADSTRMQKDFVLQRAFVVSVRFTNREGGPLGLPREMRTLLAAVATRERPTELRGVEGRRPWAFGSGLWRARDELGCEADPGTKPAGVLEVRDPTPLWISAVLRECVLDSRILHGGESEVVFALDRAEVMARLGSLSVRVVDGRTGEPLKGASVGPGYRDGSGSGVTTEEDGRVSIDDVVPGARIVSFRARDHASVSLHVRVVPGERLDLGDVELFSTSRAHGRVLDPAGNGVAAQIDVIPERFVAGSRALDTRRVSPAAADGEFKIHGAEAGPLLYVARHRAWAPTLLRGDTRTDAHVELRLVTGTPVEFRTGTQGAGERWYEVRDARGDPIAFGPILMREPVRSRLAPGAYVLHIGMENQVLRSESFSVASAPVVLDLSTP